MVFSTTQIAQRMLSTGRENTDPPPDVKQPDALLLLLPLLIVLSTFLFFLLLFLLCVLLIRRRRGISLGDNDGPVDLSREDTTNGGGDFGSLELRWLEGVTEVVRRTYLRAKEYETQYPPNSLPTDITLSQFLLIQEKGVSAWSFEPDYEILNSLLVHARTELTFLPDPASSSCVQSNLPLPKLNDVYYWEVKMFDLPETTTVAVGLTTKPYPPFRLPGLNRHSVAYHSNGDTSHNHPITAASFGPALKEGDVLGVGYRPRTGTVFFTRNGRKMEDAFVGLSRWNLFPTIGADGPCSVHVNLGQSGFVFVEANVKKWGLAPSVGTLAPPPAYGSERGSILLDVGGGIQSSTEDPTTGEDTLAASPRRSLRYHRSTNRPSVPVTSTLLRTPPFNPTLLGPPPPISEEFDEHVAGPSTPRRYISPTDSPFHSPRRTNLPPMPGRTHGEDDDEGGARHFDYSSSSRAFLSKVHSDSAAGSEPVIHIHSPPDSPRTPYPPTPHSRDIHLHALSKLSSNHHCVRSPGSDSASARQDPPAYSPLDAYRYADGVHIDLPADLITAALEGNEPPVNAIEQGNMSSSDRQGNRRN